MRDTALSRLIWKDSRTIRPLVIAIAAGVLGFNLMAYVLRQMYWQGSAPVTDYIFWILMPNLIALGAPAMLVGTEQETGTLQWMRTLPVSWRQVVLSKFVTAVGALISIWLLSSLVLWLLNLMQGSSEHPFVSDVRSIDGILYFLFFSFTLLFCGFISSFLFRSPVAALVAVVPIVFFLTWFCTETARVIKGGGTWGHSYAIRHPSFANWLSIVVLGLATIGILIAIATWIARRRLSRPTVSHPMSLTRSPNQDAFRPPRLTSMSHSSPMAVMLWQQWKQVWPYCAMISAVNILFAGIFLAADTWQQRNSFLVQLSPVIAGLSIGWLGCLVFYGDGLRRRCEYFADRGISATLVWVTRLLPVLPAAMLMVCLWWWALYRQEMKSSDTMILWLGMIVMFATGQLAAMWIRRPTLSFFAAPVIAWILIVFNGMLLLQYYTGFTWTLLLVAAILLFATWRLMPRWLEGRMGTAFHSRVIAYSLLAMIIPSLVIFPSRWATTPQAMTAWRLQMMDSSNQPPTDARRATEVLPQAFAAFAYFDSNAIDSESRMLRHSLEQELEALRSQEQPIIAEFAKAGEIYGFLNHYRVHRASRETEPQDEIALMAVEVLLRWARIVRTDCANGIQSLQNLCRVAEPAEQNAAIYLDRLLATEETDARIAELVELIPSEALRRKSRITALTNEWRNFNASVTDAEQEPGSRTIISFSGFPVLGSSLLPFERTRAIRFIDLATSETLDYLESDLKAQSRQESDRLHHLWNESLAGPAVGPSHYRIGRNHPMMWMPHWTSDHETRVARLRQKRSMATSRSIETP